MTLLNSTFDRPVVVPVDATGAPLGVAGNPLVISNPAVTVADGADATQGAKGDAVATSAAGAWSVVSLLKASLSALLAPTPAGTNNIGIVTPLDGTQPGGTTGFSLSAIGTFFTQDMTGYPSISVQVSAYAAGSTILYEVSNDGTNWAVKVGTPTSASGTTAADSGSDTSVGIREFSVAERYFRARQSVYGGSGTTTVVVALKTTQLAPRSTFATLPSTAAVTLNSQNNNIGALGTTGSANGGLSTTARLIAAAAGTNATLVKPASGRIYRIDAYNGSASLKYLKLYDKASAPAVGTDTPKRTIPLPPGLATTVSWHNIGLYLATGIGYALTGAAQDTDATALAAGDVACLHLDYA